MIKFSHSKLDVARQCMLKYKYKYVDKLKLKQEDMSASDFGSLVHEIAENYKGGGKEELLVLYHTLVPEKYKLTDVYKAKVPLALKNVHAYWTSVLAADCDKVQHEIDATIDINAEISLNGKIDLFIEKRGRYIIGDYKTSKSKEYANHTNQLATYMLILNKKYNIPYEKMDCEVIYLALDPITKKGKEVLNEGYDNISKFYKLDESDVEFLVREIEMINARINKSLDKNDWLSTPTKFNCTYCDFSSVCEKKWLG